MLLETDFLLPTGLGSNLKTYSLENSQQTRVAFSPVSTEVLLVNHALNTPFKFEAGKPSLLGYFTDQSGHITLETWPAHQRSALLGRVIFSDNQGVFYRDIDLKGVGHIAYHLHPQPAPSDIFPVLNPELGTIRTSQGFLKSSQAFLDYQRSEKFYSEEISTHRVLAILRLNEIIYEGDRVPMYDAYLRGLIPGCFEPVIAVRAFRLKARIRNLGPWLPDQAKLFLKDAKKTAFQITGERGLLQTDSFLEWFAENLGINVGRMHRLGFAHNFLTSHNICLDSSITDLDSLTLANPSLLKQDLSFAQKSLTILLKFITLQGETLNQTEENLAGIFKEAYTRENTL